MYFVFTNYNSPFWTGTIFVMEPMFKHILYCIIVFDITNNLSSLWIEERCNSWYSRSYHSNKWHKSEWDQATAWMERLQWNQYKTSINAVVRSRILGLLMLQNIITKLKQDRKNMTKEHQMSDDRIIIIDYRVSSHPPKTITDKVDSQNNDEYWKYHHTICALRVTTVEYLLI